MLAFRQFLPFLTEKTAMRPCRWGAQGVPFLPHRYWSAICCPNDARTFRTLVPLIWLRLSLFNVKWQTWWFERLNSQKMANILLLFVSSLPRPGYTLRCSRGKKTSSTAEIYTGSVDENILSLSSPSLNELPYSQNTIYDSLETRLLNWNTPALHLSQRAWPLGWTDPLSPHTNLEPAPSKPSS